VLDDLESQLEIDEARITTQQWLVMAEPEVFDELAVKGYLFDRVTDLPGMGLLLAEVEAPSSFVIYDVREGVIDVVGRGRAEVDLNHIYTASAPVSHTVQGTSPRNVLHFPAGMDDLELRLGMIDSLVDTAHPSLQNANIHSKAFATAGAIMPAFHGTAIASIFTGRDADFIGLAPSSELYAAAVFEQDRERGEIASTVSLVRALDWLISSGVDVVNISRAGPPNRVLEKALSRAVSRGVLILAAAGNGGPMAKPMYPAAYPSVMAVTAVDSHGRVFRLANRGDYVDLAAPGVGLLHARSGGGYATSSGTSFAVPFVATAAARLRLLAPYEDVREALLSSVQDEGAPGRDDIYGYGVLRVSG
ncbi:MAG: S8 family serine peptidase, partial [Haliea sp.]|nr:S8 family serine peptidase [Haliea sp.]